MTISVGIRGCGVAGLSLARALLTHIPDARIHLFDRRERLPHPERTFCYFDDGTIDYGVPKSATWNSVSFASKNFRRTVECHEAPYSLVRGDDFFSTRLDELERRGVTFSWGCPSVKIGANCISVDSRHEEFDLVFDAAYSPSEHTAQLWQSFAGYWVESPSDIFDPTEALLMELGPSAKHSPVTFIYLLPLSNRHALIEHTSFSATPRPCDEHLSACERWIAHRGYRDLSILSREHGSIPMGLRSPLRQQSDNLNVGSIAGAIRASTGYAFTSIHHQVETVAAKVAQQKNNGICHQARQYHSFPAWIRWGDRLFLHALSNAPSKGGIMMEGLLRGAPDRALIKFLAGTASLSESLTVMRHVPPLSMLKALCLRENGALEGSACEHRQKQSEYR